MMALRPMLRISAFVLALIAFACPALAAENGGDDKKSFADLIKDSEKGEGFFDIYRNTVTGDLHIAVPADQLDVPFVYAVFVVDAPVESGMFRGLGLQKMLQIERHFGRLEFVAESTAFYHDPDSPLARSAGAHMTPSTLAVADILAEDEATGALLIDGKSLFLTEALQQIKATPAPDFDPKSAFALGDLDSDRSKIYDSRSYPKNSDWFVDYVYANPAPIVEAQAEVPDSRAVSIRIQHSFIEAPDNDYEPRFDDYRVGFFTSRITDLTSDSHTPYRDVITRWDLRKSDPDAEVSDVVEPIVWWIENTTPHEWRDTVRKGVLAWNSAFEKAGLRNAIDVRVQPDDADWDAGDIRYNVLRWAASPQPVYGGIGPHFHDPRTGQILGSDISLEYTFVRNRNRILDLYDPATLNSPLNFGRVLDPEHACALSAGLQTQLMLGRFLLDAQGASPELRAQLVDDALVMLMLHEVGHTLGLNHNMKATQLLTPDEMKSPDVRNTGVLDGSIMDYAPVHIANSPAEQTLFYSVAPGPYDDWAIEFGYSPDLDDAAARAEHLAKSTRPELMFGNDADDMRSPGAGIDPRVNIYDHSGDAIAYASNRLDQVDGVLRDFTSRLSSGDDHSYQAYADAFALAGLEYIHSAGVISRYVGGVYVNRAAPGQEGALQPYVAVSLDQQQRAMQTLSEQVFAPDAIPLSADVISRLQPQRRDFDFWEKTEDPKVHDLVLAVHQSLFDHLLNPVVMKRITDSRLYGNQYTLTAMMGDLSNAVFEDDLRDSVSTVRQNLQVNYVNRLLAIVESGDGSADTPSPYDVPSRAAALKQLRTIDDWMSDGRRANEETVAHRQYIRHQIRSRLDD